MKDISKADELYDIVRSLQIEFPNLYSLLPIRTLFSDDVESVMRGLSEAAQEAVDKAVEESYDYNAAINCDECGDSLDGDDGYCGFCYRELEDRMLRLKRRLEDK